MTKFVTSKLANINRNKFRLIISEGSKVMSILNLVGNKETIDLDVVGFSSSNDLAEQVLSILSFIRYAGTPLSWIIYSDGSHTNSEISLIQEIFPFVKIKKQDINERYFDSLPEKLHEYKHELRQFAKHNILGKRLCLYLNHPIKRPTLFLDSDILFYKKAHLLSDIVKNKANDWFLPDQTWGCFHSDYLAEAPSNTHPVNAGFLLMNNQILDVHEGLEFLKRVGHNYEYFTEQTIIHITSLSNHYIPLDSKSFIVNTSDQFDFSYAYDRTEIAIRHYTGPVRHKMWQRNWRWHLSLS